MTSHHDAFAVGFLCTPHDIIYAKYDVGVSVPSGVAVIIFSCSSPLARGDAEHDGKRIVYGPGVTQNMVTKSHVRISSLTSVVYDIGRWFEARYFFVHLKSPWSKFTQNMMRMAQYMLYFLR
uniref:Uncharacterized protein n=1 Tax=Tanacetum cinerariifolium TaxID=118510 RepID=A0A6L2N9R7_TANCI|nr:hypothetical protein [Tanacetum cinerariifolium]